MTQPYRLPDVPAEEQKRRENVRELRAMILSLREQRQMVADTYGRIISVPKRSLVNLLDQIITLAEKVADE